MRLYRVTRFNKAVRVIIRYSNNTCSALLRYTSNKPYYHCEITISVYSKLDERCSIERRRRRRRGVTFDSLLFVSDIDPAICIKNVEANRFKASLHLFPPFFLYPNRQIFTGGNSEEKKRSDLDARHVAVSVQRRCLYLRRFE